MTMTPDIADGILTRDAQLQEQAMDPVSELPQRAKPSDEDRQAQAREDERAWQARDVNSRWEGPF